MIKQNSKEAVSDSFGKRLLDCSKRADEIMKTEPTPDPDGWTSECPTQVGVWDYKCDEERGEIGVTEVSTSHNGQLWAWRVGEYMPLTDLHFTLTNPQWRPHKLSEQEIQCKEFGDLWVACHVAKGVSCIGKSREHAIKGVADAIASNEAVMSKLAGSETTKTEGKVIRVCLNWDNQGDHVREVVMADEYRQLETQLAEANKSLEDVEKLITDSGLHRVECGGLRVGHCVTPRVIRLFPTNSKEIEEYKAKSLQQQAARARKWAEQVNTWKSIAINLSKFASHSECCPWGSTAPSQCICGVKEALAELEKLKQS